MAEKKESHSCPIPISSRGSPPVHVGSPISAEQSPRDGGDLLLIPQGHNMQILAAVQVENQPNHPTYILRGERMLSWSNYNGDTIDGAAGTRDVVIVLSEVAESDNVVARHSLEEQLETEMLVKQGVHKNCHQSDLHIMMMRYILNSSTSTFAVISAEKTSPEQFKKCINDLMTRTTKDGIVLHYIGPGQMDTGNWCFKNGFISFEEIMELYTEHFKKRVLTIVSDCSYSGRWVKEAMTFMDAKDVGPCGHKADDRGILVKVYASCQEREVPTERVFSTQCITNDEVSGNMIFKIHLKGSMIHSQDPSGLDFTGIRCNRMISGNCNMAARSTWSDWGNGEQIHVQAILAEGKRGNVFVQLYIRADCVEDIRSELKKFRPYRANQEPQLPGRESPPIPVCGYNSPIDVVPVGRNIIVNYSFGHL